MEYLYDDTSYSTNQTQKHFGGHCQLYIDKIIAPSWLPPCLFLS